MGWDDLMAGLAAGVVDAFSAGGPATITRVTPGAFSAATQSRAATTISGVVRVSKSARRASATTVGSRGIGHAHEVEFLVDAAELAATSWGSNVPKEGDIVTHAGVQRPIVRVEIECDGKVLKLICRDAA